MNNMKTNFHQSLSQLSLFCAACKMTTNLLKPPEAVRGMQCLDRERFTKTIRVPRLQITQPDIQKIMKHIKKYLLKLERFKPIFLQANGTKTVYLNPLRVNAFNDLNKEDRECLESNNVLSENFSLEEISIKYENYSVEDVFRAVLPTDREGMASFTKVGHIVHVNLREHLLPFKSLIGEVLLDKVTGCRSVVNKIDSIDNTYRNFKMEVLCGEEDYLVSVKENGCTFEFDFSTVYWNSRLCTEHERIVKMIGKDDVVFDAFAGVGPFSVPISKRGSQVFANDLNPESFKWLNANAKKNKTQNMKTFNLDAKDFILTIVKEKLIHLIKEGKQVYILMNLPAMATEFLRYFSGMYYEDWGTSFSNVPIIYLYCFAKGEDCNAIAKKLIDDAMGKDMSKHILEIFKVRTVSSMKEMMRVKLKLDEDILIAIKRKRENNSATDNGYKTPIFIKKTYFIYFFQMAKNKKKNIFKVTMSNSFKAKKPKAVTSQLKKLTSINKEKVKTNVAIQKIDKDLESLKETVRLGPTQPPNKEKKKIELNAKRKNIQKDHEMMEQDSNNIIANLNSFELN